MTTSFDLPLRIVLVDDHSVVRHGMASRLAQEMDFDLVGSFAGSREMLQLVVSAPIDVVVMDFALGPCEIDGLNLIRALKVRHPKVRTLVMSGHYTAATVRLALKAGARGFVGKTQELDDLVTAIRTVASGRFYLHSSMSAELAAGSGAGLRRTIDDPGAEHPRLSPRESEVLRCFLDGMSVSQVAAKFSRSINTISTQKKSAFRKLGVGTDRELFKLQQQFEKP